MDKIQMVDLKSQYENIEKEIDAAIKEVITTSNFINGKAVKEFSQDLKLYLNVKHVIPCGNGTDAIQIALMSLDLKPGDEVITSTFTFIATAEVTVPIDDRDLYLDAMEEAEIEAKNRIAKFLNEEISGSTDIEKKSKNEITPYWNSC